LTETQRQRLYDQIRERASSVGIGIVSPEIIDDINILEATRLAMIHAVGELGQRPDYLLIDGPVSLRLEIAQRAVIKGDRLSFSIAAAGIVAKVTRDRIMLELHEQYPVYGFDRHKGYPTATHREAILRHGPCPVHRKTFHGIMECEQMLFSWK
jgi:ribonuclease HII